MNEWAFTLCMACVLAGGLELLMPRKEYEKSIKVVVALYILVTVLQPVRVAFSDWDSLWPSEQTDTVDFSGYRAGLEQQALEEQLEQALAAQGLDGQIQVETGPPLTVTARGCTEPERAETALRQVLGEGEEIEIKAEGPSNGT
ncbi:stage III sporulation protein AF [Allofournierella massiliensis]|uniref:Stage III sporulation protein AF n=1 Tax=Allofournierella massiliensis TaxID=1650663 RepID=A0ABT7UNA6_9FIRM|nr:stage III sporulation protein AF [Fournierella massiliensis]MDM8200377.1 stage III sporulation protein AF [Fournierella massiliensis]